MKPRNSSVAKGAPTPIAARAVGGINGFCQALSATLGKIFVSIGRRAVMVTTLATVLSVAPFVNSALRAHEPKANEAQADSHATQSQSPVDPNQPSSPSPSSDAKKEDFKLGHFGRAEYLHTLLNPMPVYGLSMGLLALCAGLAMRNRQVVVVALVIISLSGLAAWPTYYLGERAYDRVRAMSDAAGGLWLDEHMARAEKLISVFYLLAALGLAGIAAPLKWPRSALPLAIGTLVVGVCVMGVGGWIAYAGGHVRHQEFRFEPPPKKSGVGQGGMDHAKPPASTANGNQHREDGGNLPADMNGMDMPQGDEKQPRAGAKPMDHSKTNDGTEDKATLRTPEALQLEASRLQLDASRLQLEASRKALENAGQALAPDRRSVSGPGQPSPMNASGDGEAEPSPQPSPTQVAPHPH